MNAAEDECGVAGNEDEEFNDEPEVRVASTEGKKKKRVALLGETLDEDAFEIEEY
jgi:hypothetical protein